MGAWRFILIFCLSLYVFKISHKCKRGKATGNICLNNSIYCLTFYLLNFGLEKIKEEMIHSANILSVDGYYSSTRNFIAKTQTLFCCHGMYKFMDLVEVNKILIYTLLRTLEWMCTMARETGNGIWLT